MSRDKKDTHSSSQEWKYDSENLVTWEQMQRYDEVTPWRLKVISPQQFNTEIAWSLFSPWSKHTPADKQQQLEIYRMLKRQWDPGIHRPMLIHTKSVLIIGSFWRYADQIIVKATGLLSEVITKRDRLLTLNLGVSEHNLPNPSKFGELTIQAEESAGSKAIMEMLFHCLDLENKELQSKIHSSVRGQWDPGIITATAWGQAVFRGGDNVTTQTWPKKSPTLSVQLLNTAQPRTQRR